MSSFSKTLYQLIPNFLGLIPYEIYILPGMYLAIFQVLWLGSPNPIQFHLLPHWFGYSIFQLLKGTIKAPRPGCHIPGMKEFIDDSHCHDKHAWQSFPSGHTGIASSLATALFMEMMYSDDPHFFEMNITNIKTRRLIAFTGIFVAFTTAEQISATSSGVCMSAEPENLPVTFLAGQPRLISIMDAPSCSAILAASAIVAGSQPTN